MFFGILVLFTAVLISSVAAYFSIVGLAALFAAIFWPVIVMGCVLEFAKLVSAAWLHYNWRNTHVSFFHKFYLIVAILALMTITALGIYGYLAKGHLEQNIPINDQQISIEQLNNKILIKADNISLLRREIDNIEKQKNNIFKETKILFSQIEKINIRLDKLTEEKTTLMRKLSSLKDGFFKSKKKQRNAISRQIENINIQIEKERTDITQIRKDKKYQLNKNVEKDKEIALRENKISEANRQIGEYKAKKINARGKLSNIDVKLGPIKYLSKLMSISDPNNAILVVILIIMFAFDPLAICLVISGLISITEHGRKRSHTAKQKEEIKKEVRTVVVPTVSFPQEETPTSLNNKKEVKESKILKKPIEETPTSLNNKKEVKESKILKKPTAKSPPKHGDGWLDM